MLQMNRFEYWHLSTNVASGSIWISTFGNFGTDVANGSIRILIFVYQCCKWIDPNIDIWVPMLQMDRSEYWHLGTNVANGSIWILTFGYQCCKWIDMNIDIWIPMLQMDRYEYWHLGVWILKFPSPVLGGRAKGLSLLGLMSHSQMIGPQPRTFLENACLVQILLV